MNTGRRQRKDTISTLKHQAIYEMMESIRRKTFHVLTLETKQNQEGVPQEVLPFL